MKKSFTTENPASKFLTPQPQGTPQPQETAGTPSTVETAKPQKVEKLPRLNMKLDQENLEYLQIVCRLYGTTQQQYINDLLKKDAANQSDKAKQAMDLLRKGV